MKRLLCILLVLIFSLPASSVYAGSSWQATQTIGDIFSHFDDMLISGYKYSDTEVSFTIPAAETGEFKKIFSQSSLVFDADATQSLIDGTFIDIDDLPHFLYDDVEDHVSMHLMLFNETYFVHMHEDGDAIKVGVFTYKDAGAYSAIEPILENYAKIAYDKVQAQPKFTDLRENEQYVYNVTPIYTASFMLNDEKWYWGFCSYTLTEENKNPLTAAYLSTIGLWGESVSAGIARLAYGTAEDNVIDINTCLVISQINNHEVTKLRDETAQSGSWAYTQAKMHFNVNENNNIEGLRFTYVRRGNTTPQIADIDMSDYDGALSMPEINGFTFNPDANFGTADPDKKTETETSTDEKDKKESDDSESLLSKIRASDTTISAIEMSCTVGKATSWVKKTAAELKADGTMTEIESAIDNDNYTYKQEKPDGDEEFKILFTDKSGTNITMYELGGYMVLQDAEKNIEYHSYRESKLRNILISLRESELDSMITDFIHYTKADTLNVKWTYNFDITLNDEQMDTWLGEVAENGKVHVNIMHEKQYSGRYYITLSGNGKSYTLARNSTGVHNTDYLLVNSDTVLPHCFEKGGAIKLSWAEGDRTVLNYNASDDLYVTVYAKKDNSKRASSSNIDFTAPVGGKIPITKIDKQSFDITDIETDTPNIQERGQVFSDVPESHWAHSQIEKFYYSSIVRGIGAGLCAPEADITNEHFGFLLDRLFGYKYENTSQTPAIRQDVIAAVVKACALGEGSEKKSYVLDKFDDTDLLTDSNMPYVQKAVEDNLAQGYDGRLHANDNITRAEAITLLYRAIKTVYDITDDDLPEFYKLQIRPDDGDHVEISSNKIVNAEIVNPEYTNAYDRWLVNVSDASKLDGGMLVSFGDDAIEDTHIYAVCNFGGDIYTFDSQSMLSVTIRSSKYITGSVYCNIYRNGKIYKENAECHFEYDGEISELNFTVKKKWSLEPTWATLIYGDVSITNGKMPKIPDVQPIDIEMEERFEFSDGKTVYGSVTAVAAPNVVEDTQQAPSGSLKLDLNKDGTKARVSFEIAAPTSGSAENVFKIEIAEVKSISDDEVIALFDITSGGITIAENVSGKISGLANELGEDITFVTDDELWNVKLKISEKSGF